MERRGASDKDFTTLAISLVILNERSQYNLHPLGATRADRKTNMHDKMKKKPRMKIMDERYEGTDLA